jgi:hypothetical protein
LAIQEPMAGRVQPIYFPTMWATDPSRSFLRTPAEMLAIVEAAGFRMRAWNEAPPGVPMTAPTGPTIQRLVMGDSLDAILAAGKRTNEEHRQVSFDGVFDHR